MKLDNPVRRATVVGAGTMGHGIAQVAAMAGIRVVLYDLEPRLVKRGLSRVRENLDKGMERGKVTETARSETLSRITVSTEFDEAVAGADLVVEAAPEDLALKRSIFERLDRSASPLAVLASNTSSLPVGDIAAGVADPGRVIGTHFFNPVHLMPLLEVVRAPATRDETVHAVVAAGEAMGKECIVVADVPGFATSRLGVLLGLEAIRMVEQGVASPEDIDKAMTLGYRHPVGPLKLTDLVGLDVRLAIAEHLHGALASEAFRPPELLRTMVSEGKLGKKTGRGFYVW